MRRKTLSVVLAFVFTIGIFHMVVSIPVMAAATVKLDFYKRTDGKIATENVSWDMDFFKQSATIYNHNLAHAALILSNAAYEENDGATIKALSALGFDYPSSRYYAKNDWSKWDRVAYTFAYNKESKVVAVVLRGTPPWTGILSSDYPEWASNLSKFVGNDSFANATFQVRTALQEYIKYLGDSNIGYGIKKYFITGHSRGGAVANLLGADYTDNGGVNKEKDNIYVYTYASPNCTEDYRITYNNIFNICDSNDFVTSVYNGAKHGKTYLTKYGSSKAHSLENYLSLIKSEKEKIIKFFNPDAATPSPSPSPAPSPSPDPPPVQPAPDPAPAKTLSVNSTTEGRFLVTIPANFKLNCYKTPTSTNAYTFVSGKASSYQISCTMKFDMSDGSTRYFFKSGDTPPKDCYFTFTNKMSVVDTTAAPLPSPSPEPAPTPSEATGYTIYFVEKGNSITSTKTVINGKPYGELPVPSRNGYRFLGWYTSGSGGSQVTESTIVNLNEDDFVYAHWQLVNPGQNIPDYPFVFLSGSFIGEFVLEIVNGGLSNDHNAQIYTFADLPWQRFETVYTANGYYLIAPVSGMVLTADSFGNVYESEAEDNLNQMWYFIENTSGSMGVGSYAVVNAADGRYLSIDANSFHDGANVAVKEYDNSNGQTWYLVDMTKDINTEDLPAEDELNLDTASEWARDGIQTACDYGYVPYDLRGNYTDVITRAEFCRMAVKWLEYVTGKSIDGILAEKGLSRNPDIFSDTNDPDILAAFALGITNGTGNNQFTPNGQFTREQAAAMIMSTCRAAGADIGNPPDSGFADIKTASDWAIAGINFVRANGIMQGTGNNNFSPQSIYTREQSILTFVNINVSD